MLEELDELTDGIGLMRCMRALMLALVDWENEGVCCWCRGGEVHVCI